MILIKEASFVGYGVGTIGIGVDVGTIDVGVTTWKLSCESSSDYDIFLISSYSN